MIDVNELNLRKAFWELVGECLKEFHGKSKKEARSLITKYLKAFPLTSTDPSTDLVYHFEPFGFACEMTKNELDIKDFADKYEVIASAIFSKRDEESLAKTPTKIQTKPSKTVQRRLAVAESQKPKVKRAVAAAKKVKPAAKTAMSAAKKAKPTAKKAKSAAKRAPSAKKAKPAAKKTPSQAKKAKKKPARA